MLPPIQHRLTDDQWIVIVDVVKRSAADGCCCLPNSHQSCQLTSDADTCEDSVTIQLVLGVVLSPRQVSYHAYDVHTVRQLTNFMTLLEFKTLNCPTFQALRIDFRRSKAGARIAWVLEVLYSERLLVCHTPLLRTANRRGV